MFERFTDGARQVVVLAREEARMLIRNYIGTEYFLLGLIRDGEGGQGPADAARCPSNETYQSHMLGPEKTSGAGGFSLIPPAAF
jgi:hypothetical protein